jgi:predicted HicB family RNase H-like nuclease
MALGSVLIEGDGSRVSFTLNNEKVDFHRPHPGKDAFRDAVDFNLESCKKSGRVPNKPFSGKFVIRVESLLHGEIVAAAASAGKSVNKWVADTLAAVVHAYS